MANGARAFMAKLRGMKFPVVARARKSLARQARVFSAASSRPIPLIDLSHPPEVAAREIHEACRSVGFFQIHSHGVPETLRARVLSEAGAFFSLPQRCVEPGPY